MRKNIARAAVTVALTFLATGAHATTNLINNGSFETGDFTGWSLGGDTDFTGVVGNFSGVNPEDGNFQAYLGSVGSDTTLSQTFSDVAGQTYTTSLWMASFGGTPSDFGALLDGATELSINPVSAQGYTQYTFSFTGTGSDTLTIFSRNDPSYQLLDNVSVSGGAVPEPASWALMMSGLGLIGGILRSRRTTVVVAI
jgi:hypothetical protein